MTDQAQLGTRVRKARRNAGYTQLACAKALGCSAKTIWNWESQTATLAPQPRLFRQFADLTHVSVAWLYDGEDLNEHTEPRDDDQRRHEEADS